MATAFTQLLSEFLLRMTKLIHQLPKTCRFFNGVKISTLNVLDDRNFKNLCIRKIAHQNRNFMQLRHLRSTPTAFTRDNLVLAITCRTLAYDEWLNDALCFDGSR